MRSYWISALAAFLMLGLGCQPKASEQPAEADPVSQKGSEMPNEEAGGSVENEISLSEVFEQVKDGTGLLVDVRSDDEWNESHFARAQHISIDMINADASVACAGLDKEKTVFLH